MPNQTPDNKSFTFTATISKKGDGSKKYKIGYKFIYEREPHVITGFWEPGGKYVTEQISSYDIGDGIRPIIQHVLSTEEIDACMPKTD